MGRHLGASQIHHRASEMGIATRAPCRVELGFGPACCHALRDA